MNARMLDYTEDRYWGHDVTWRPSDGGLTLDGSGWHTPLPRAGDWLGLPHQSGGGGCLYRITEVRPCGDPSDMFHFRATFVPGRDAPKDLPSDDHALSLTYP